MSRAINPGRAISLFLNRLRVGSTAQDTLKIYLQIMNTYSFMFIRVLSKLSDTDRVLYDSFYKNVVLVPVMK